jgi:hypothetical protein
MLTDNETKIVKKFQETKIPSVYKLDNTDNILYVEHVDFDLCCMLLKNKRVNIEYVQNEIKAFSIFLSQLDVLTFDRYDRDHLNLLIEVVNIFIKNNL